MNLFSHVCPECGSEDVCADHQYKTKKNGVRTIYHYRRCDIYFSETFGTPIAGLTTNLSRIIEILKARSEEIGLNATARTFSEMNIQMDRLEISIPKALTSKS